MVANIIIFDSIPRPLLLLLLVNFNFNHLSVYSVSLLVVDIFSLLFSLIPQYESCLQFTVVANVSGVSLR